MKKFVALFSVILVFTTNSRCQDATAGQPERGSNFTQFTSDKVKITHELDSLTTKEFKTHPEYGVLPYNAPCQDCIEILQKREGNHRYFVKEGSKGRDFYSQTAYGELSYRDQSGALRTIDHRIKPTIRNGVFNAYNQPFPVSINIPEKFTSIVNEDKELRMNRDLNLYILQKDGSVTPLGNANWSDYTAGDDGIIVHNFYPGIDLELHLGKGTVESFYRINKPLNLQGESPVIHDNMQLPDGLVYDYSYAVKQQNGFYEGSLFLSNSAGANYYLIGSPAAYDENGREENYKVNLDYRVEPKSGFDLYVPISWMNDPSRSYPILIDPIFTATTSVPVATITGSGYNSTCFAGGCKYDLDLTVPAATIVDDITITFWYRGYGTCTLDSGAWDLTLDSCHYPSKGNRISHCEITLPGLCQAALNLSCFHDTANSDMKNCVVQQCQANILPFVLTFYRCTSPGAGYGFSCINIDNNTPWSMTINGHYISATTTSHTICQGDSIELMAQADSGTGIPPYTYKWYYPGGFFTGDSILIVSPATTTTYSISVLDCQPALDTLTDSAQVYSILTVKAKDIPGFTISPFPMACQNTNVIITGNNPNNVNDSCYTWFLPGTGKDTVARQRTVTVQYPVTGTYPVILQWIGPTSGCMYYDTMMITIDTAIIPSITMTVSPGDTICAGTQVTFNTTSINPGSLPVYQWYIGQNAVPGANGTSFVDSTLNNGDTVKVVLDASNVLCVSPFDSASIVMTVIPIDTAGVTITAKPTGIICKGNTVTLTADTSNGFGGTQPTFKWLIDDSGNYGNAITFSYNNFQNNDSVAVIMTSSRRCTFPDSAISNWIVIPVFPPVTVTSTGDTLICACQPVQICASAAGGTNSLYTYSWSPNGSTDTCAIVTPCGTTLYTVTATDSCHSYNPTSNVTVTIQPSPVPDFNYSPPDANILAPTVYFNNLSNGAVTWSWDFGDTLALANASDTSTSPNPIHTYSYPGTYSVKMVVSNSTGCYDSITITVEIKDLYYFYIPNSFSPNGDGINDFFAPQGTDQLQSVPLVYTMTIYNRWGEKVFETDNTSQPWNGEATDGTKVAQTGVYVYRIKFTNPAFSDKVYVGTVTLVR